jgi:hypothetical protein
LVEEKLQSMHMTDETGEEMMEGTMEMDALKMWAAKTVAGRLVVWTEGTGIDGTRTVAEIEDATIESVGTLGVRFD